MNSERRVRLLVGGPRASGKSTLSTALYRNLVDRRSGLQISLHELDVHSDTHAPLLGLKDWSERQKRWPLPQEAPREVMEFAINSFRYDPADIVIGDLPGRLSNPFMPQLLQTGTHALYVGRDFADYAEWQSAFKAAGIGQVWRAVSLMNGQSMPESARAFDIQHIVRNLDRKLAEPVKLDGLADSIIRDMYYMG